MSLEQILAVGRQEQDRGLFRTNLVFCLFLKSGPKVWKEPAHWLVGALRSELGEALGWGLVGANAKSFAAMTKARWDRVTREIDALGEKEHVFFRACGPDYRGADCDIQMNIDANCVYPDYPRTNYVQVTVPVPESPEAVDHWEQVFRKIAEKFRHDTGYAAPALIYCSETEKRAAGERIGPLALRHPGFDVPNNDWTSGKLGTMSRGARWLTFLSPAAAEQLDAAMLSAPVAPVRVDKTKSGLVIRSSPLPEVGDVNRQRQPQGLAWVARLLDPITRYDDPHMLPFFRKDPDLVSRWEHRFEGD